MTVEAILYHQKQIEDLQRGRERVSIQIKRHHRESELRLLDAADCEVQLKEIDARIDEARATIGVQRV